MFKQKCNEQTYLQCVMPLNVKLYELVHIQFNSEAGKNN